MFRSMKWFRNGSSASRKPARRPRLQIEALKERRHGSKPSNTVQYVHLYS
jgi:hypothetical protein